VLRESALFVWVFIFLSHMVCAQEVISQWDDPAAGLAGWEKASMNTFTEYHNSGGNPGGHLRAYGNLKTGISNKQPELVALYKTYQTLNLLAGNSDCELPAILELVLSQEQKIETFNAAPAKTPSRNVASCSKPWSPFALGCHVPHSSITRPTCLFG